MKDFMTEALPWICVGIGFALAAAGSGRDKDGENESCMAAGMCIKKNSGEGKR